MAGHSFGGSGLSCVCPVCLSLTRVGNLCVSADRSSEFRAVALDKLRLLQAELLDLVEVELQTLAAEKRERAPHLSPGQSGLQSAASQPASQRLAEQLQQRLKQPSLPTPPDKTPVGEGVTQPAKEDKHKKKKKRDKDRSPKKSPERGREKTKDKSAKAAHRSRSRHRRRRRSKPSRSRQSNDQKEKKTRTSSPLPPAAVEQATHKAAPAVISEERALQTTAPKVKPSPARSEVPDISGSEAEESEEEGEFSPDPELAVREVSESSCETG